MESFYTGIDAKEYRRKIAFIVKSLIKQKIINPKNKKKAKSEAYRFMIDRFYEYLRDEKYNGFTKKLEG